MAERKPSPPRARRRVHPLFGAGLAAVAVAALLVTGAAAWRHGAEARRVQLAEWQSLVASGADPAALVALRGAARAGETAAQGALGEALLSRPADDARAEGAQWLRVAATGGSVQAQFLLGKAAFLGTLPRSDAPAQPDSAPDYAQAWTRLAVAADAGHAGAAYYLGLLYRGGHGKPRDAAAAAHWLTQAAKGGVAQAMFLLANAYREGDGVPRDEARAVAWYEAAAEREHPASIQALAMAYRDGELGLRADERSFRVHLAETAHALRHPALNP